MAYTEIMVIYETADETIYVNGVLGFQGTKTEAQVFAGTHNFGGGVEIAPTSIPCKSHQLKH